MGRTSHFLENWSVFTPKPVVRRIQDLKKEGVEGLEGSPQDFLGYLGYSLGDFLKDLVQKRGSATAKSRVSSIKIQKTQNE